MNQPNLGDLRRIQTHISYSHPLKYSKQNRENATKENALAGATHTEAKTADYGPPPPPHTYIYIFINIYSFF